MPVVFYVISYFFPQLLHQHHPRNHLRGAGLSHLWLDGLALTPWAPFFFSSPPAAPEQSHHGVSFRPVSGSF